MDVMDPTGAPLRFDLRLSVVDIQPQLKGLELRVDELPVHRESLLAPRVLEGPLWQSVALRGTLRGGRQLRVAVI